MKWLSDSGLNVYVESNFVLEQALEQEQSESCGKLIELDVVVGLITTQTPNPLAPTDCELLDWKRAGLHAISFFRLFPVTFPQQEVRIIGRLSDSDRSSVRTCFRVGLIGG